MSKNLDNVVEFIEEVCFGDNTFEKCIATAREQYDLDDQDVADLYEIFTPVEDDSLLAQQELDDFCQDGYFENMEASEIY